MGASSLKCRECGDGVQLEARYVCERCFGPLEVAYDHSGLATDVARAAPPHPGRAAEHLALRGLPAAREPARSVRARVLAQRAAGRLHAADPRRPARRAPRPAARCGSRTTPPTRRTRSRTASCPSPRPARARARLRGRSRAPRPATSRTRSPPTPPRSGMETYVFIPADLEEQKILATGVYGTNLVEVKRQLRRRQPALHRAVGRARLGVRQRQPAPVLRRGLEDARVRDRRAARLGDARPHRRADRLRLAVHEDRQGLLRVARARAHRGRRADDERRPGRGLLAGRERVRGRPRRLPPGQARTRSPSRWRSATRPTARTRSTSRAGRGGSDRRGHRRRDPRGHPPARRDDGHLHRDRRRRDDRGAREARRARRHRPRRARRARHHRRGPQDARRGARHVRGARDRAVVRRVRRAASRARGVRA